MPRTPKSTDGEAPKKRTRKAPPAEVGAPKALKTKSSTPKVPKAKTKLVEAEAVAAAAPVAVQAVAAHPAREVATMPTTEERIRLRAYELYLRRGGRGGSPEQDWFQAMAEIYGESVA